MPRCPPRPNRLLEYLSLSPLSSKYELLAYLCVSKSLFDDGVGVDLSAALPKMYVCSVSWIVINQHLVLITAVYSDGGFNAPSQQQRPSPSSVARLPQEILDPRIASTVSGDIDSVQRRRRYNEEHDVLRRSKTGSLQGLKQLDNYQCRFWNPIWLDTRFLPPLAVLFAAMAIAVLLMLHFSAAKQGLVVQQQANHYGWTYGPTGGT